MNTALQTYHAIDFKNSSTFYLSLYQRTFDH